MPLSTKFPTPLGILLISTLAWQTPQAATLTNAYGFNAFIFGDLSASGGDTEGRLAVGGTMTVTGGYSVSGCSSPDCTVEVAPSGSQPQSNGTRDDLVVAGNINHGGGAPVSWSQLSGNARVGGAVDPNVNISFIGGNQLFEGVLGSALGVDFAAAESALLQDSATLSALSSTGNVVTDTTNTLTLQGTNSGLNVFNLTADQWGGSAKSRYIDTPLGSQIVINVSGLNVDLASGILQFGAEGCLDPIFSINPACQANTDYAPNVLVNYFEATTISMSAFEHQGAVLAPLATLDASGGSINGQTVLASADTDTGFEFHFRANNGNASTALTGNNNSVPVPPSLLLLLAGLIAVRRR